uniref:hypothetical protein n=1 Tax=Cephaleuros parasiticus TaxID=173370 RepID=UPI001EDF9C8A|nr:hypothetical protein MFQ79_pgp076 [Cephaleuros parasiticus]UIB38986.1 hypothetical protein [Cephaleuros parasiticus]
MEKKLSNKYPLALPAFIYFAYCYVNKPKNFIVPTELKDWIHEYLPKYLRKIIDTGLRGGRASAKKTNPKKCVVYGEKNSYYERSEICIHLFVFPGEFFDALKT